jgi:hypothetical protein
MPNSKSSSGFISNDFAAMRGLAFELPKSCSQKRSFHPPNRMKNRCLKRYWQSRL